MPWVINTTVYELKGNFSRFLRALLRGDADFVVIRRYNRDVATIVPLTGSNKPALEPENAGDRAMRARATWGKGTDNFISRRPPPPPRIF